MMRLRNVLAFTLLHWALKAFHRSDPMRPIYAEVLLEMATLQLRWVHERKERVA